IWRDESEPRRQEKDTPNEPVIRDLTTDRYVQATCRHHSSSCSVNFYLAPHAYHLARKSRRQTATARRAAQQNLGCESPLYPLTEPSSGSRHPQEQHPPAHPSASTTHTLLHRRLQCIAKPSPHRQTHELFQSGRVPSRPKKSVARKPHLAPQNIGGRPRNRTGLRTLHFGLHARRQPVPPENK